MLVYFTPVPVKLADCYNAGVMLTKVSHSVETTQTLAERIGRILRGGEVIDFSSDVGGGKTTFMKGLARGLAVTDVVQSPTFTISRIYHARNDLELHHFDFYRLSEPGIIAAELAESLAQPNAIVTVEWGNIVQDVLPPIRMTIRIRSLDENSRRFTFDIPHQYDYIAAALGQQNTETIA
jgi:tRNA threonylcarbamoyladenosine biosynthesis protein TsaE